MELGLQLATQMGNRLMFEHIMRKRLRVVWEWGPAIQYEICLRGIDSSGDGGNDVLEIICEPDVRQETASLLLDDVFYGLLHKVVLKKWSLFGRYMHVAMTVIDSALFVQLVMTAFDLKRDPLNASRFEQPLGMLLNCVVRFCIEIFFLTKRWLNMPKGQSVYDKVRVLFSWMVELDGMWRRLVTTTTSMIAALLTMTHLNPTAEGHGDEIVWILLSISTGLQGSSTVNGLFMPFEKQAIYLMSMERCMSNEVLLFVQFLIIFTLIFSLSLYIAYPRAGTGILPGDPIPQFNDWDTSIKAMFDEMIGLRRWPIDLDEMYRLSSWESVGLTLFLLIYFMCVMLVLQLMYRFLNATLTSKFNSIQKESTLQWRLNFARQVLRSEFMWFFWDTSIGDADLNYQFQHVRKQLSQSINTSDEDDYDAGEPVVPFQSYELLRSAASTASCRADATRDVMARAITHENNASIKEEHHDEDNHDDDQIPTTLATDLGGARSRTAAPPAVVS